MKLAVLGILLMLAARQAEAQQSAGTLTAERAGTAPTGPAEQPPEDAAPTWSFSLAALTYIAPDSRDYVQPTLAIDHDWLHLEARYNYEDLGTASLWIGYNFSFGDEVKLDITPMVGGVFGDTRGVAPGYEMTLAWRALEFYTEGEFVFDADDSSESFFYSWSELTLSPTDWLRAGIAAQRTKIRAESSDIEIGPMIGLTYERFDFSAYVLFPGDGDPTVALGVGVEF